MKKICFLICSLLFAISPNQSNAVEGFTDKEIVTTYNELMPKTKSWDELYELMSGYLYDPIEKPIVDCFAVRGSLILKKTIYQNILYNDYIWNEYKTSSGLTCIELTTPNIGYLTETEAKALVLAGAGYKFEELGIWKELFSFNEFEQSITTSTCIIEHGCYESKSDPNSKSIIGLDDRVYYGSMVPYMVYLKQISNSGANCKGTGTGFFINKFSIVTAGHIIKNEGCETEEFSAYTWKKIGIGGLGGYIFKKKRYTIDTTRSKKQSYITNTWDALNSGTSAPNNLGDFFDDYGMLKITKGHLSPVYPDLVISYTPWSLLSQTWKNNIGYVFGFPADTPSSPGNATPIKYGGGKLATQNLMGSHLNQFAIRKSNVLNHDDSSGRPSLISHFFDQREGQSGSPLFYTESPTNPPKVIGVLNVSFNGKNYAAQITNALVNWGMINLVNVDVILDISPNVVNWYDINDTTFKSHVISTSTKNTFKANNEIESNLIWDVEGVGEISRGYTVSGIIAKSVLRTGTNYITLSIDSPNYFGGDSAEIFITGPEGEFIVSSTLCIIDLSQSSNSCIIPISWQTTNAPNAMVYNNRTNKVFSNNPQGSNVPFSAIHNQDTELVLYASQDKIYDIDRVDLSAKLPTGNLTKNTSVCSLQPSPIDPNTGLLRDPKATPPGCGAQLSWSNVQWASPTIFYKLVDGTTWQQLYQIPCQLNGEMCSGSINTDEILPELIPINGVDFKLLQFNNANSGVLTAPFTITAHRFADAYEFDNGDLTRFNYSNAIISSLPTNMKIDDTLSYPAEIGVPQHNRSFHAPASYDPLEDVDTTQIPVNQRSNGSGFNDGDILTATVFNMANGLDIGMNLECAGFGSYITNEGELERFEGIYSFQNNPIISNNINPVAGTKTIEFSVSKETSTLQNGVSRHVNCIYNRIVLTRLSGTPSENLTYSVVVNKAPVSTDITWINKVNVSTTPNSITKTAVNRWNGGAISSEALNGNGYVQFQKVLGSHTMIGLSHGDSSQNYNDIDYAIFMSSANTASVYESGSGKHSFGSFVASDVFQVKVENNQVKYLKNGIVSYTSFKIPTFPLNIDTSLYHIGATINNIVLVDESNLPPPVVTPDQYDNVPSQRAYDDDVRERPVSWLAGDSYHLHNFHDAGDSDWTIVYMQGTRRFRTELLGSNADTKMYVYKWISGSADPNLSGAFINIVDEYVGEDTTSGGSSFIVNAATAAVYAVKVQSRNGTFGNDTNYKLIIDTPPNVAPKASFTYSCNYLSCSFNAASSSDSDGSIVSYVWSIGGTSVLTSKTFLQAGSYPVTLTVTDNGGAKNSITKTVAVFSAIAPDQYDNVPSQRAYDDDVRERPVSWMGGDSYHLHNFHDAGDSDWTIVYMTGTRTVRTELIGSRATTNLYVYKWISGDVDPNLSGAFTNLVDQYVGSDTSGSSSFTINAGTGTVFAIKVKSRYGYYGSGTEYKLLIQ